MSIAIRPTRRRGSWERVYRITTIVAAAQFGWVFVMGLLAGGQFLRDEWPDWEPLAEWPVMAVPAWFTIAVAVVAAVAAVGMAAAREVTREVGVAFQDLALGVLFLGLMPLGLANLYAGVGVAEGTPGWHWIATAIFAVTAIALIVRVIRSTRRARTA